MASFANPRLAAAVANAGGQGTVTLTGQPPAVIEARLDDALEHTPGPIAANFFLAVSDPATVPDAVAAAARYDKIVNFFYGDPDPDLVALAHAGGALVEWQVG